MAGDRSRKNETEVELMQKTEMAMHTSSDTFLVILDLLEFEQKVKFFSSFWSLWGFQVPEFPLTGLNNDKSPKPPPPKIPWLPGEWPPPLEGIVTTFQVQWKSENHFKMVECFWMRQEWSRYLRTEHDTEWMKISMRMSRAPSCSSALYTHTQKSTQTHSERVLDWRWGAAGVAEFNQELLGLGRSKTMGAFMGWKFTVHADALINVVVPSVIMP